MCTYIYICVYIDVYSNLFVSPDTVLSVCVLQVWTLLDSQNFLVRQRRNRVYGVAMANSGCDTDAQYKHGFASALHSLQTHCHFKMDECFDKSLPATVLSSKRECEVLKKALAKAQQVAWHVCT